MGLSLALGRTQPRESVQTAYDATQKPIHVFEAGFGGKDCHVLLGCGLGSAEGHQ